MARKKPLRRIKRYTENHLYTTRYRSEVKALKEWCEDNYAECKTYDTASPDDICVVSLDEYHLHDSRKLILEDKGDYFLNIEDYEKWAES